DPARRRLRVGGAGGSETDALSLRVEVDVDDVEHPHPGLLLVFGELPQIPGQERNVSVRFSIAVSPRCGIESGIEVCGPTPQSRSCDDRVWICAPNGRAVSDGAVEKLVVPDRLRMHVAVRFVPEH